MPALGHRIDPLVRLMAMVKVLPTGCWEFTGFITPDGYGTIANASRSALAHVSSFLLHGGTIPEGYVLDHKCHVKDQCDGGASCPHRRCVNPGHLEPCTRDENIRRGHKRTTAGQAKCAEFQRGKTHCPRGHSYAIHGRTRRTPKCPIERRCMECDREYQRRKKREANGAKRLQS